MHALFYTHISLNTLQLQSLFLQTINIRKEVSSMGKFQENMVYSVYDICKILGCSNNKGYALVHEAYKSKNMFRVIKIGSEYKMPIDSFNHWLQKEE